MEIFFLHWSAYKTNISCCVLMTNIVQLWLVCGKYVIVVAAPEECIKILNYERRYCNNDATPKTDIFNTLYCSYKKEAALL